MTLETFYIQEATTEHPIQQIEQRLNQIKGIERVLIDTSDGEVKVEFDSNVITKEQINSLLKGKN